MTTRRRQDRTLIIIFIAALTVAGVATVISFEAVRRASHTSLRLEEASLGVCERLQVQRERVNVSDARQFIDARGDAALYRSVAKLSPQLAPVLRRRAEIKDALAGTSMYGPRTNCQQALADPPHYHAPTPVSYDRLGMRFARRIVMAAEHHQPQPIP